MKTSRTIRFGVRSLWIYQGRWMVLEKGLFHEGDPDIPDDEMKILSGPTVIQVVVQFLALLTVMSISKLE
jgi:hypothetical protein